MGKRSSRFLLLLRPTSLVVAVLALVGGASVPRGYATEPVSAHTSTSPPPVLGISYRNPRGTLAWFDTLTLKSLAGRKAPLAGHTGSWAFSEDRARLAVASCADSRELGASVRFVNARSMRVLGDLRLAPSGCAESLTWVRLDRLLSVFATDETWRVIVVDPIARRVVRRSELPSWPSSRVATADGLVLLLGTYGAFGPARVAVVDAEGAVRTVSVGRVLHGTVVDEQSADHRARTIQPGLAVDPDGHRAFLVQPAGPVAEIDLETLEVSYHELERRPLLQRFLRWLVPAAQAKVLEGPVREARWLGNGMIVVSGQDYSVIRYERGDERVAATPAGVTLIDTSSWTSHVLEVEASGFVPGPGLVVAQGGRWDSEQERGSGPGLRAFGLDGRELWQLHAGEYRWMDTAGHVGYAYVAEGRVEVVDLATGRVLGTVGWDDRTPLPQLLAGRRSDR